MMAFIDERGRVFGRFNLIDVAAVLFVAVLVPMGYVAYRIFRVPAPEITSVAPATLGVDSPRRIKLSGKHFRPYLGAFVARTGEPYSLVNRLPDTQQAAFLVETPTLVELALPPVGPGTYDIHLYDEAQEVASRMAAFTIAPPQAANIEALVRFVVPPEVAPLVKEGDRDRWEQNGVTMLNADEAAVMGSLRETKEPVTISTAAPPATTTGPGAALQALVRIPASKLALGGWEYKTQHVRAGETLIFETDRYRINGVILRTTEVAAASTGGR